MKIFIGDWTINHPTYLACYMFVVFVSLMGKHTCYLGYDIGKSLPWDRRVPAPCFAS
ncbi:hypothetical protein HanPSC8_Chr05g0205911 [Helianthus annuus]|nr:hypothetical protein HanPSC8_Chr05g0205911 [Helianthus annuus]